MKGQYTPFSSSNLIKPENMEILQSIHTIIKMFDYEWHGSVRNDIILENAGTYLLQEELYDERGFWLQINADQILEPRQEFAKAAVLLASDKFRSLFSKPVRFESKLQKNGSTLVTVVISSAVI